jgi:hypothetical protein
MNPPPDEFNKLVGFFPAVKNAEARRVNQRPGSKMALCFF